MEKVARSTSSDPVQEKLRQHKANFNAKVSALISDVINLKKLMNGAPNHFFKEKSKITEPIPADPATIIGVLASDFQNLAQEANAIISEQIDYAKNRRKAQPKQNQPIITSSDSQYYLISEASNVLTRFFTYILNPAFGSKAREKRYRTSLLSASATLDKDLKRLQSLIVGSGPKTIFEASKVLDKIEDNFSFLLTGLQTYQVEVGNQTSTEAGLIENPKPKELSPVPKSEEKPNVSVKSQENNEEPAKEINQDISKMILDYQRNSGNFLGLEDNVFWNLIKQYNDKDNKDKSKIIPQMLVEYNKLLEQARKSSKVQGNSLEEILNNKANIKSGTINNSSLETIAQNMFGKWVGKLTHQLNPFDKTSAMRLDVYNNVDVCRKKMDEVMNSLQKEMNPEALSILLAEVNKGLLRVRELMRGLNSSVGNKDMGFGNSFMNMLERGKITDQSINLQPDQKQKLDKMLRHKQLQELSKMYSRK